MPTVLAGQRVRGQRRPRSARTGMPAPVAIRAASTLVTMPPVPTPARPVRPMATPARSSSPRTSSMRRRVRPARVAGVESVHIGQQDQQVGVDQRGHQRGEAVVVAEADLLGGDGVVLVDDRDGTAGRAAGAGSGTRCGSAPAGSRRRRSAGPARRCGRAGRTTRCTPASAGPARRWPRPAGWPGRAGAVLRPSGASPAAMAPDETSTHLAAGCDAGERVDQRVDAGAVEPAVRPWSARTSRP